MQSFQQVKEVMQGDYKERGFCTVVAIACAFDWSAGKAHRLLKKHGRPNRNGPTWRDFTRAVEAAGEIASREVKFTHQFDGITINRLRKLRPTGTYIVGVRGHALCLKDGEFMDWTADTAGRRKIIGCMSAGGVAIIN